MAPATTASIHSFDLRSAESDTYRRWVTIGACFVIAGYSAILPTSLGEGVGPVQVGELIVLGTGIASLGLLHLRRVGWAASLLVLAIWLQLHFAIYVAATAFRPGTLVLPSLVLASGLLMGRRAAWIMAGVTAVSANAVAWLGRLADPAATGAATEVSFVIIFFMVMLGTAALLHFGLEAFEKALDTARDNAASFERLVAEAPDGIVALDAQAHVLSANPAALQALTGPLTGTAVHLLDALVPDDRGPVVRWLAGGMVGMIEVSLSDGDRTIELTGRALGSAGGGGATSQVMLRDVSDRVHASRLAAELSRIVRETPAEVVVFDEEQGEIILVSRGARDNLGYLEGELAKAPVERIAPGLDHTGLRTIRERIESADGGSVRTQGLHRRKDGTAYPVDVEYAPACLQGRPVLVAFLSDITERVRGQQEQRELQRQLEHSQKMEAVGHLAGGVAHDFNNLLTVIGGCAEVLKDEVPSDLTDLVGEISAAQTRGGVLIRQLLAFARKEVAQPRVLHLQEVLQSTEVLVRRLAGERIDVAFVLDPDVPPVLLDPGQVEQVTLNLIANARDAMPDGGTVRIELAQREPGWVQLTVADSGCGMPAGVRERIFEPFFTTKGKGEGTGLGLATVHGIVIQGGGRIAVRSTVGVGTTFAIDWPITEQGAQQEEPAVVSDLDRLTATILFVEDFAETRSLVSRLLRREGHVVHVAESAEAALALDRQTLDSLDMVITDVVMPGISGIEMSLRLNEMGIQIPTLFVSGYLDEGIHGSIPGDERETLLLKPFSRSALNQRVQTMLARADRPSAEHTVQSRLPS